jgi:DNA repair protein RadA/Sms
MALAMASSYTDKPIPADLVAVGEIGLSGEVRAVSQLGLRLNEAAKIGFRRAIVPRMRRKIDGLPDNLEIITARNVAEALAQILPDKARGG